MNNYPQYFLRGIREEEHFLPHGQISLQAFKPDDRTETLRGDGFIETSINWEDDEKAHNLTAEQFRFGYVKINKSFRDNLIEKQSTLSGLFDYERKIEPDNPYHGNILFRANLEKPINLMIMANIALHCEEIYKNNE